MVTGGRVATLSPNSDHSLQDLEHSLHRERLTIQTQSIGSQELEHTFTSLFPFFLSHQQMIPEKFALRIKKDGVHRVVCDFLSSLGNDQLIALVQQYVPTASPALKREQLDLL